MSMPQKFRTKGRTTWSDHNRQGAEVDSFLEGPSFDRAGNLYFVDIPFGRVFRITRPNGMRSEEHTSELQSRPHLVCRLLLEKKKRVVLPNFSPDLIQDRVICSCAYI